MDVFDRYAPFVQDFIYDHEWENLRAIQVAAAEAIFNTDDNVLLTASTASGKTEAAFFPILTLFDEDPPASVGALYVGPLKALINDQFLRLNDLCAEANIPVWHWHGDVAQSHKRRLLKHPSGILQITPESLEALLLHRHSAIAHLFGDLRFVVIDEVHSLMRGDRGGQTLCGIERLSRLAGVNPRRIGLSATIGDPEATGRYLSAGTGRNCVIPRIETKGQRWRVSMEHFYIPEDRTPDDAAVAEMEYGQSRDVSVDTEVGVQEQPQKLLENPADETVNVAPALPPQTEGEAAALLPEATNGEAAALPPKAADTAEDAYANLPPAETGPVEDVIAKETSASGISTPSIYETYAEDPEASDNTTPYDDELWSEEPDDATAGPMTDASPEYETLPLEEPLDEDDETFIYQEPEEDEAYDTLVPEPEYELPDEPTEAAPIPDRSDRATVAEASGSPSLHSPAPEAPTDSAPTWADPGIAYIFEHTRGRKCLVFANSREQCESVTTTLRQYCEANGEPDRFLIHHGNLSSSFRMTAEEMMRDEDNAMTTVTTATLELGIDIGRLERAFQIDAPFTVSSFLQRMGRTGRRGQPPEMWFVMREEMPEARALLPETIPWKLLQGIALIQLYLEERWVEPPSLEGLPYSLLYHQTMATLASCGELTAGQLAERVLTLTPFHRISLDDYRVLLRHLLNREHIERTETGGLIVGLAGERITNNFKFYAVFQENEEYTVRSESQELGTIVQPPPVGERIALAGHVWVIDEIDHKRHLIEATKVKGKVPAYFGECPGDINTHILERMRGVLRNSEDYPYLMDNARNRLAKARHVAANAHLTDEPLICLGGKVWCLLPWLGTYAFLALERFIKIRCAKDLGIKALESARPYYLQFTMQADKETFFRVLREQANREIDPMELLYPNETPYFDKYDDFVPDELVRKGFAYGVLDIEGMLERVHQWTARLLTK